MGGIAGSEVPAGSRQRGLRGLHGSTPHPPGEAVPGPDAHEEQGVAFDAGEWARHQTAAAPTNTAAVVPAAGLKQCTLWAIRADLGVPI